MTDFDKESELLSEWLTYRIDWIADYLLYFSPKVQINLLKSHGMMFIDCNRDNLLSFEEWKQFKNR